MIKKKWPRDDISNSTIKVLEKLWGIKIFGTMQKAY